MGNMAVKNVKSNKELEYEAITSHALIYYNFVEEIIDEEETILLASDPNLYRYH